MLEVVGSGSVRPRQDGTVETVEVIARRVFPGRCLGRPHLFYNHFKHTPFSLKAMTGLSRRLRQPHFYLAMVHKKFSMPDPTVKEGFGLDNPVD